MFVKVCGLKEIGEVDKAIELGYDAIGVVLEKGSKRYCPADKARELAARARGKIKTFAVAATFDDVKDVQDDFDFLQIYEQVPHPKLVFASAQPPPPDLDFHYFLYDASRGSGRFENFPAWLNKYRDKLILAGGLSADNVKQTIRSLNPFGVDVSSAVEKDGRKDFKLMEQFIREVRDES